MSLVLWLIGALIASAGTAVYVELGTGLPRSGAEKNYLEFMYRKPKYLATCVYAFEITLIVRAMKYAVDDEGNLPNII